MFTDNQRELKVLAAAIRNLDLNAESRVEGMSGGEVLGTSLIMWLKNEEDDTSSRYIQSPFFGSARTNKRHHHFEVAKRVVKAKVLPSSTQAQSRSQREYPHCHPSRGPSQR
jgi:hypothetical protein